VKGAYNTQANREHILTLVANELHALGYRGMTARSLKPKYIEALIKHWFAKEHAIGTIKNRMAAIRWWARKVNKQNVVARCSEHYDIPDRRFVTNESKANTCRVGLSNMHGLRHAYAQNRYEELTGWKAPAAGGLVTKDLTSEQRKIHREVRLQISRELCHDREAVVSAYIGR
jgi:hypothetical protein